MYHLLIHSSSRAIINTFDIILQTLLIVTLSELRNSIIITLHDMDPIIPPRAALSIHQASFILAKHGVPSLCHILTHLDRVFNTRNTTYILKTELGGEYVLRFSESWGNKTENEVASIRYLANATNLPVPVVIGFCSDPSISPNGYEYILMEKLRGVVLGDVFRDLELSKKKAVVESVVQILKVFQTLTFDKIGGFYFRNDSEVDTELGPLLGTPNAGPFSSYLDFLKEIISTEVEKLQRSRVWMEGEGATLVGRINDFKDKVCNPEITPLSEEVVNVPFVFSHTDLHSFNILVDEDTFEITGIIDFELAGVYPLDMEWFKCFSFVGASNKAVQFFGDGLRTMSDSGTEQECKTEEELEMLRDYFFEECQNRGVQTQREIPGHGTRAVLHYFVKYICPWWMPDGMESQPPSEKWIRDRNTCRERLKGVLNMYGV